MNEEAAYAAFERDVPAHLRDDAIQMMSEATSGWDAHACVSITERDRIDAVNYHASGIITIEGREFSFQMEDGNNRGTVLLDWDTDKPFERHEPTRWALQPQSLLVEQAIDSGRGAFLVAKWDAIMKQTEIAEIPGKYAYDKHFAPGVVTERHWSEKAAKRSLVIVTEETAAATRAQLLQ